MRLFPTVLMMLLATAGVAATPASLGSQPRMTPRIQAIVKAVQAPATAGSQATGINPAVRYDAKNRLQIDVEFDCAHAAPSVSLEASGMRVGTIVDFPPLCVIEGWAPVSAIPVLASLANVTRIDLPKYPKAHPPLSPSPRLAMNGTVIVSAANGAPAINGNGVAIMNADKYVQQTGINGAGVTVGVISDDVTNLALIQGRGELPASVNVVQPSANPMSHSSLTDEGTMMLEEVYAVAPGANLAFCGPETGTEYFACVQNLVNAGATLVSDDLTFVGFDVMSGPTQNAAAQALQNLFTANPRVTLFHSVGNDAQDYFQATANLVLSASSRTCAPSGEPAQTDSYFQQIGSTGALSWSTQGGNDLFLASAMPAGQSSPNSLDVFVYSGAQLIACGTPASGGTTGSTSYTVLDGSAIVKGSAYQVFIGSQNASLNGALLKLIGVGDGGDTFSPVTAGAPASPQDFAAGVITVGAVYGNDGVGGTIETYSDVGPIQLAFPTAATLQAPVVVAPDGIFVDTIGTLFQANGGLFFGTSAASPNAAAVAALLESTFPTLTPLQVATYLQGGAAQLGGLSPSATFGYGRVDALGALSMVPPPTLAGLQSVSIVGGSSSPALPFTVGGTGVLNISAVPTTNLIPSGSAGAVISPANCGNPATACTLTLTPAIGSSGSTTVQVSVTDRANRTQAVQLPITVSKPTPPTVVITSGGSQSVIVSSAIAPIAFTVAGTGSLTVTAVSSTASAVTLTPGCGSATLTCTANLGTASSTAGTTTLMLGVQDAYAQHGSASATVTESKPGSGSGALDGWTLVLLSLLAGLHGARAIRGRLVATDGSAAEKMPATREVFDAAGRDRSKGTTIP
jgi:Subtilase family